MGKSKEKSSDVCFSSSVSHEMCRSTKKRGGKKAGEDKDSTRIESIPGRNRNNTHLEKFLNLDDITNFFYLVPKSIFTGSIIKRQDLERLKHTCNYSLMFCTTVKCIGLAEVKRQIQETQSDEECTHFITNQYLVFLLVTENF